MPSAKEEYLDLTELIFNAIENTHPVRVFTNANTRRAIDRLAMLAAALDVPAPLKLDALTTDELPRKFREESNPLYHEMIRERKAMKATREEVKSQVLEAHRDYFGNVDHIVQFVAHFAGKPIRDLTDEERGEAVKKTLDFYTKQYGCFPVSEALLSGGAPAQLGRGQQTDPQPTRIVPDGPIDLAPNQRVWGIHLAKLHDNGAVKFVVKPLQLETLRDDKWERAGDPFPFNEKDRTDVLQALVTWANEVEHLPDVEVEHEGVRTTEEPKAEAGGTLKPKENNAVIAEYIRQQREAGRDIHDLTRDGIATATKLSYGAVSATRAWQQLRDEKSQTPEQSNRRQRWKKRNSVDDAMARGDWPEVQRQQENEAKSKRPR